jgi:hypothetical protein
MTLINHDDPGNNIRIRGGENFFPLSQSLEMLTNIPSDNFFGERTRRRKTEKSAHASFRR